MIHLKPTAEIEAIFPFATHFVQLGMPFIFNLCLQVWIHGSSDITLPKFSSIPWIPETMVHMDSRRYPKIAIITAAIGKYEKRTKGHVQQTIYADYYCFTDNHELQNSGNWTLDHTPYHIMNLSQIDNGGYRNSRGRNTHPYMVHKFYKMQFHHIPRLYPYDMIVWTDMTMTITKPDLLERLWSIFQVNSKKQIILRSHIASRRCTIQTEMRVSVVDSRWRQTFMMNQRQPFQDVRGQYDFYLRNGYTEEFWKRDNLSYRRNACIGLWMCGFIAFRMADPIIPRLLDWWYFEQLNQTTQDQISFPYVAQKLGVYPYTLPDNNYDVGHAIRRVRHGD
jgi:hypothetical protein